MKYFSMPADFKKNTVDGYAGLNKKYNNSQILETYGNITEKNIFCSGRADSCIPGVDKEKFEDYIKYSRDAGLDFNYTLNAPTIYNQEFTVEGIQKIEILLEMLDGLKVYNITVSIPSLIDVISKLDSRFKIRASTICQITNVNEALAFKKLGVDKIVVKESINRKFGTLKKILENFGDNVEVITNVICHKDCIYRIFHYLQDAFDYGQKTWGYDYYVIRCVQRMINDPANILRFSWIRPEDISKYENIGIKYYKMQGRQAVIAGNPVKAAEYYFKESYDGDLMHLLWLFSKYYSPSVKVDNKKLDSFLDGFLKSDSFCSNSCNECRYCNRIAEKAIYAGELDLYQEYVNSDKYDKFKSAFEKICNGRDY